jgi:RHS repeat-associated protein
MQTSFTYDCAAHFVHFAYKFTGKERDTESGLDYFGSRYYSSNMGRFMSPDPKQPSMKHLMNPQKWNKYAYVLNNPLSLIDPDGMEELQIQLRAFIPQSRVGPYRGDNRGPITSQSVTSRTQITFTMQADRSMLPGGASPVTQSLHPGAVPVRAKGTLLRIGMRGDTSPQSGYDIL